MFPICIYSITFSGKDSVKFDKIEIAIIAFLSAVILILSLIFSEAPKSSAVIIRIFSWSYGVTPDILPAELFCQSFSTI